MSASLPPDVDRQLRERCEQLQRGLYHAMTRVRVRPAARRDCVAACIGDAVALCAALEPYGAFILTRLEADAKRRPALCDYLDAWGVPVTEAPSRTRRTIRWLRERSPGADWRRSPGPAFRSPPCTCIVAGFPVLGGADRGSRRRRGRAVVGARIRVLASGVDDAGSACPRVERPPPEAPDAPARRGPMRDALVALAVAGQVANALVRGGAYRIGRDGVLRIVPGTGGIALNKRIGDRAIGLAADHVEPGVSVRNNDREAGGSPGAPNRGLLLYSCVGNVARWSSADRRLARVGTVTGKHGGINNLLIDFPPDVLRRLRIGDRIQVTALGQGLALPDYPACAR